MPANFESTRRSIDRLIRQRSLGALAEAVMPSEETMSPRLSSASSFSRTAIEKRWALLGPLLGPGAPARQILLDEATADDASRFEGHVENFVGTIEVPVGLAGPLRVRGLHANGDFYVPMATTEAALVASCTRGAQAISRAGGCSCAVLSEGVSRAPGFVFDTLVDAGRFVYWVTDRMDDLRREAEATSRYAKLVDLFVTFEGSNVYLRLVFEVGEASGQNMVTIATDAACRWVVEHSPVKPVAWYVEANLSGDKKATAQSFQGVRGKKVVAEATLSGGLVATRFHCSAAEMARYHRMSAMGGVLSGSLGVQGHYANALAAVYLATGQDVACVAESAVGVTRFEARDDGSLYAAVTLPNIIVGTVGGGTALPGARAALGILGLASGAAGSANALAEITAAMCLAGELSIIAALAAGHFTDAHLRLARGVRAAGAPGSPGAPDASESSP